MQVVWSDVAPGEQVKVASEVVVLKLRFDHVVSVDGAPILTQVLQGAVAGLGLGVVVRSEDAVNIGGRDAKSGSIVLLPPDTMCERMESDHIQGLD